MTNDILNNLKERAEMFVSCADGDSKFCDDCTKKCALTGEETLMLIKEVLRLQEIAKEEIST